MTWLKTSVLGGLSVLLPLMLLWIGLREIGGLLASMATPIADLLADLLPAGFFDNLSAPGVVALILIVGISLVFGLAAKKSGSPGAAATSRNQYSIEYRCIAC